MTIKYYIDDKKVDYASYLAFKSGEAKNNPAPVTTVTAQKSSAATIPAPVDDPLKAAFDGFSDNFGVNPSKDNSYSPWDGWGDWSGISVSADGGSGDGPGGGGGSGAGGGGNW